MLRKYVIKKLDLPIYICSNKKKRNGWQRITTMKFFEYRALRFQDVLLGAKL